MTYWEMCGSGQTLYLESIGLTDRFQFQILKGNLMFFLPKQDQVTLVAFLGHTH